MNNENDETTFVSEEAKYVFYLTHTNGIIQEKGLGITLKLYEDIVSAYKWYTKLLNSINANKNMDAAITLKGIYLDMLEDCIVEHPAFSRLYPEGPDKWDEEAKYVFYLTELNYKEKK